MTFAPVELGAHIKANHPGCPPKVRKKLIARIRMRDWPDMSMGNAVGITMENYLRHDISGYDNLLRLGIERNEARRLIRPQVDAILELWQQVPAEAVFEAPALADVQDLSTEPY